MFSERVGELFVQLSAKGDITQALAANQAKLATNIKLAAQYEALMKGSGGQAYFQAQADGAAKVMQARLAEQQALARFYASPVGQVQVKDEQTGQKALQRAKEAQSWAQLVATQGRSGAALTLIRDRLGNVYDKVQEIGRISPWAFAGAAAGATGLAAAAAPWAMSTFTGSFTLLAAVIGQELVPYLLKAAQYVQYLARTFRDLSPATKGWVGSIIAGGVALLGLVAIGTQAILMLKSLAAAALAVNLVSGGSMLGRFGGSGLAAGAGGAGLTSAAGGGGLAGMMLNPVGLILGGLAVGITAYQFDSQRREREARGQQRGILGHVADVISWTSIPMMLGRGASWLTSRGQNSPNNRLAADFNFQSQFYAIEQQWRNLQTTAASMTPLQQEILSVQNSNWDTLLQQIANNTAPGNGMT